MQSSIYRKFLYKPDLLELNKYIMEKSYKRLKNNKNLVWKKERPLRIFLVILVQFDPVILYLFFIF